VILFSECALGSVKYFEVCVGHHQPFRANFFKVNIDSGVRAVSFVVSDHTLAKLAMFNPLTDG